MGIHKVLNPQQKKVLEATSGVKLVISGPGTGKTTTITHFLAEIIEKKQALPQEILALTFTNKAADEMKQRVYKLIGRNPDVSTIHSFAATVLRRYPPLGFNSNFLILDDGAQYYKIANIAKELGLEEHPNFISEKLALARNLRDKYILEELKLLDFYRIYINALKETNAIDYDGLLTWCVNILENNQEILNYYQNRYKVVLVDEFQDINPIQYDILKLLIAKHANLLCVGDFDQSIYSFRGADLNIMLNLEKDFPEIKIYFLEQNYRSTPNIIQCANRLIKNNKNRKEKTLWTKREEGKDPIVKAVKDEYQEALFINSIIQEEVKKGKTYSDFAVLYRIHTLGRVVEEVFSGNKIPYQVIGGMGFFQRKEIQNLLAFFKLIVVPNDNEVFLKVTSILAEINNTKNAKRMERYREADTKIYEIVHELSSQSTLEGIYEVILGRTGYLEYLKKNKSREGERRVENVEELRSVLVNFDKDGYGIDQFLNFIENTQLSENQNSVKIMTVHAAKGLEYDTVFVVGAEKGMFPYYSNEEIETAVEEERRLFYVAVTRAKNNLYILYPQERSFKGKKISIYPSQFIKEIQQNNIESVKSKNETERKYKHSYKSLPKEKLTKKEICLGIMVIHNTFGKGHIIKIDDLDSELTKVDIKFSEEIRSFILEMAPLRFS